MKNFDFIKATALSILGVIGSGIVNSLGGWDMALKVLIGFMAFDYITGLVVAGVFKKSGKSENGALKSTAGWKGLFKKGMMLGIVYVATQVDALTGTEFIRNAVVIGYVTNEAISIFENAGLMGVPIGKTLTNAIDVLRKKVEEDE